jgi:hypothetical protein
VRPNRPNGEFSAVSRERARRAAARARCSRGGVLPRRAGAAPSAVRRPGGAAWCGSSLICGSVVRFIDMPPLPVARAGRAAPANGVTEARVLTDMPPAASRFRHVPAAAPGPASIPIPSPTPPRRWAITDRRVVTDAITHQWVIADMRVIADSAERCRPAHRPRPARRAVITGHRQHAKHRAWPSHHQSLSPPDASHASARPRAAAPRRPAPP